ncbi:MAG: response regulator [Oligoflexia bacterium]|nr:response regulator [Oligoflexia bacterium]
MRTALVVDDNADTRDAVSGILSRVCEDVWVAESLKEAFKILDIQQFDVIVCDLHLPFALDRDVYHYQYSYEVGLRMIKELEEVYPDTPIIAMTATMPWDLPKVMKDLPHIPTLSKPFAPQALLSLLQELQGKSAWI